MLNFTLLSVCLPAKILRVLEPRRCCCSFTFSGALLSPPARFPFLYLAKTHFAPNPALLWNSTFSFTESWSFTTFCNVSIYLVLIYINVQLLKFAYIKCFHYTDMWCITFFTLGKQVCTISFSSNREMSPDISRIIIIDFCKLLLTGFCICRIIFIW